MGPPAREPREARSPTTVLIAESDRALAELYRSALEPDGWDVDVVSDAAGVMSRMHRAPPAVLLLSTMPDASQLTIAEQVRSLPGTQNLVLIVLFDSFDHLDPKRLGRLNVTAWLSRTRMTREKLSETIANLVAKALQKKA